MHVCSFVRLRECRGLPTAGQPHPFPHERSEIARLNGLGGLGVMSSHFAHPPTPLTTPTNPPIPQGIVPSSWDRFPDNTKQLATTSDGCTAVAPGPHNVDCDNRTARQSGHICLGSAKMRLRARWPGQWGEGWHHFVASDRPHDLCVCVLCDRRPIRWVVGRSAGQCVTVADCGNRTACCKPTTISPEKGQVWVRPWSAPMLS